MTDTVALTLWMSMLSFVLVTLATFIYVWFYLVFR